MDHIKAILELSGCLYWRLEVALQSGYHIMDKDKAKAASAVAKEAFAKKDYVTAVQKYTEAISFDPNDHLFFSNRSACYANLKQYDDALDDARKCVELKPDFARGYSRKGLAEFYTGKYKEAVETYTQGLKLDPNNDQMKEGLQEAQNALQPHPAYGGAPGEAETPFGSQKEILAKLMNDPETKEYFKDKDFLEKLKLCQSNPQLLFSLMSSDPRFSKVFQVLTGISMADLQKAAKESKKEQPGDVPMGGPQEAPQPEAPKTEEKPEPKPTPEEKKITETEKKALDSKSQAEEEKAKGNAAYKAKKLDQALEFYEKAVALNPKEPIYYLNKASVFLGLAKYEDCLKACDKAIEVGEEVSPRPFEKLAKAFARKGNCFTAMKKWEEALTMYDKSLLEDNDPAVREAKRNCEHERKRLDDLQYVDPAKAEEHKEKGNKLFRDGNFSAAIKEYDEAIRRDPQSAVLRLDRGMTLMKLLDYTRAITDVEKSIQLDPKYVKAYAKKGNIHYFTKEYHKAIAAFDQGLKLDPTNQECIDGKQRTQDAIYQSPPDEDRARRAMDDPEIRALLQDPRIIQVLKEAKENPSSAMSAMSDPFIAQAIQKLIAAGIIGTK